MLSRDWGSLLMQRAMLQTSGLTCDCDEDKLMRTKSMEPGVTGAVQTNKMLDVLFAVTSKLPA